MTVRPLPPFLQKRDWSLHSRSNRNKRKLAAVAADNHSICEYYAIIQGVEKLMLENTKLKKELVNAMQQVVQRKDDSNVEISEVLKMLLDCAKQNAGRKPQGHRYSTTVKELGTLFFTLGGPLLYGIISKNLPFPGITSARRNLLAYDSIQECVFRIKELKNFLVKRNYPLKVHCCEDGTKKDSRIQYDLKTNQIVGFVPALDENGLPLIASYPATSAAQIESYFANGVASSNVYVIMAQPLVSGAPSFCVAMWGTDNKFNSLQVQQRWKWMVKAFKEEDIEIVSFSADGDPKLLSAMYCQAFTTGPSPQWKFFSSSLNEKCLIFTQDMIHILMKLKAKFLKPSDITPFGKEHLASRGDLIELINTTSKDLHCLSMSDIEVRDKMNFRAAQKLCDSKVTSLLRQNIPGSEATATYLDMMRETVGAFLDPQFTPLERVKLLWKWVFFLRLWRKWLVDQPGYSLGHNFISSNSYTCIELNAHAMIQLIRKFRDSEEHELFLPSEEGSQPCEDFFRKNRSLTSTQSTITNFSTLEFVHKIRRIDFLENSFYDLKDTVHFPRKEKAYRLSAELQKTCFLPEDFEIKIAVDEAYKSALKLCVKFGIAKSNTKCPEMPLPSVAPGKNYEILPDEDDEIDENVVQIEDDIVVDTNECDSEDGAVDDEDDEDDDLADVQEDLLMISTGCIGLTKYKNVIVTPTSPYVLVLDGNGKECIIKKTSLCWLLCSGDTKLSSDRLLRVQSATALHSKRALPPKSSTSQTPFVEEIISVGDWCAFVENGKVVIGRISAFSYMTGSTWRNQEYSRMTAPVQAPSSTSARGLGVLCSWFNIKKNSKKLETVNMDVHGYYSIENYICTLPRPKTEGRSFLMRCTMADIMKLKNGK